MAAKEDYAAWIVANKDKKGSPEFETVAAAYKATSSETTENDIQSQPQQQYSEVPQWAQDNPALYGVAGATRDVLSPLLEFGGLVGGGIVGAGVGGGVNPVTGVGGAGLGYAGGKELTKFMDIQLGNRPDDESFVDTAKETGSNIAEGSALEAGGQAIVPLAKALYTGGKEAAAGSMDLLTGAGKETFERLAAAGKEGGDRLTTALKSLRGKEPAEIIVSDAKNAILKMGDVRGAQYLDTMKSVQGADRKIDFQLIDDAYKTLVDSYKYTKGKAVAWKAGSETQRTLQKIKETIDIWRYQPELHTTMGFDALKQRIFELSPPAGSKAARAVTTMYNEVKNTIVKKSPEYAKIMKQFEDSITQTKSIEKELSLGKNASDQTALRKILAVSRNNANTNWGGRKAMVEALEEGGGANILDRVAGHAASSVTPRGMARVGGQAMIGVGGTMNPALLAALPFMSPRLMGELSVAAGKGAGAVEKVLSPYMSAEAIKQLMQSSHMGTSPMTEQLRQ